MENFQDRRQHKRVEGSFEVFVNIEPESPENFYCISKDISEGGMRIRTPKPLKNGNHIILSFDLPNYAWKITTQGVVAWASGTPKEDGSYESGVRFLFMNDLEKEAVCNYIALHSEKIV